MASEVVASVASLARAERKLFFAKMVAEFDDEIKEASGFEMCDACGKHAAVVYKKCQAYKGNLETCCEACVTHCVCGEDLAPSAPDHSECDRLLVRCYCGLTTCAQSDPATSPHGNGCELFAKVFLKIEGDLSDFQHSSLTNFLADWEMRPDVFSKSQFSSNLFKVNALWNIEFAAKAHPNSIFRAMRIKVLQSFNPCPLELVAFTAEFTDTSGQTVTSRPLEFNLKFTAPCAKAITGVNFNLVVQVKQPSGKRRFF